MTETARLALEIDFRQANDALAKVSKGFDGLVLSAAQSVTKLDSVEKRLSAIAVSARGTAQNTEFLTKGLSAIALNGQRTAETLARIEQGLSRVALNTQKAAAGARGFGGAATEATQSSAGLSRGLDGVGTAANKLRGQLGGLLAGLSFAYVLRDATKTIAGFEAALATLRGVTGLEKTGSQFQAIESQARRLGATTRFTAQEAAEGQLFLARAGFKSQQILAALPATLNLAAAGNIELGTAADLASNAITQFNLDASETERVVDALVNVSNNSNTNILQLGEALKFAGPVANAFGISIEETAAALGKLGDAGIQGTLAGTGLRGLLGRLADPSNEASKRLKDLVGDLGLVDVKTRGLTAVLKTLQERNLSVTDSFQIFGRLQAGPAIVLARTAKGVEELVRIEERGAGAAKKLADIQNDTLQGSFLALKSAIQETYLAIGDGGYLGGIRGVIDTGTSAIRILNGTATAADRAREGAEGLAVAIRAVTAGLVTLGTLKLAGSTVGLVTGLAASSQGLVAAGAAGAAGAGAGAAAGGAAAGGLAAGLATVGSAIVASFTLAAVITETLRGNIKQTVDEVNLLNREATDLSGVMERINVSREEFTSATNEDTRVAALRAQLNALNEGVATAEATIREAKKNSTRGLIQFDDIEGIFTESQAEIIAEKSLDQLRDAFQKQGGAENDLAGFLDFASKSGSGLFGAEAISSLAIVARESGLSEEAFLKKYRNRVPTGGGVLDVDISNLERGRRYAIENTQKRVANRGIDSIYAVTSRDLADNGFKLLEVDAKLAATEIGAAADSIKGDIRGIDDAAVSGNLGVGLADRLNSLKSSIVDASDQLRGKLVTELERATRASDEFIKKAKEEGINEADLKNVRENALKSLLEEARAYDDLVVTTEKKKKADAEAKRITDQRARAEKNLAEIIRGLQESVRLETLKTDEQRQLSTNLVRAGNEAIASGRLLRATEIKQIIDATVALQKLNRERAKEPALGVAAGPISNPFVGQAGDPISRDPGSLFSLLSSGGEKFRDNLKKLQDAKDELADFQRGFADEKLFLQADIAATRAGRPEDAERFRTRLLAQRELNELLEATGDLESDAGRAARANLNSSVNEIARLNEELRRTQDARRYFDDLGRSGAEALADIALGASSVKDAIAGVISELSRLTLSEFFTKPAASLFSDGLSSLFGGGIGGLFGGSSIASANGNAFEGGRLIHMANGGVLTSRSRFALNGRDTVEAGEAGPEGILPLMRDARGRLGVISIGGGSSTTYNTTTVNNIRIGGGGGRGRRDTFGRSDRQIASDIVRGLRSAG